MSDFGPCTKSLEMSHLRTHHRKSNLATGSSCFSDRLRRDEDTLGSVPKQSLKAFEDLGLSDTEISRYFNVPIQSVKRVRRACKLDEAD